MNSYEIPMSEPVGDPTNDKFTSDPNLIFNQATSVEVLPLGTKKNGNTRWFLVFSRPVHLYTPPGYKGNPDGTMDGVEIAAYESTQEGQVYDWSRRYEWEDHSISVALSKLRYSIANDLAFIANYENIA